MKKTLFITLLLGLYVLIYSYFHSASPSLSEKEMIVREIESKGTKRIQEKLGLIPIGAGAQMMDQIQVLVLIFQYNHPIRLEEGRKLIIDATNEYLDEINSCEKIRKYLQRHPFRPWNVEIMISFLNPESADLNQDNLEGVMSSEGKLIYHFITPDVSTRTYKETFEEALKILEEEKQKAA